MNDNKPNWMLTDAITRVTDNRELWKQEFDEYHANLAEANATEYWKAQDDRMNLNWGNLWAGIYMAIVIVSSIVLIISHLNKH
jgi:hypothetical protein